MTKSEWNEKGWNFSFHCLRVLLAKLEDAATAAAVVGQLGGGLDEGHSTLILRLANGQADILGFSSLEKELIFYINNFEIVLHGKVDFEIGVT